jgi:hypothetical protein
MNIAIGHEGTELEQTQILFDIDHQLDRNAALNHQSILLNNNIKPGFAGSIEISLFGF